MADNGIRGKNKVKWSNLKTWRDYSYQKAYNNRPEQVKKRTELNKLARKKGIYGKRWAKWVDISHKKWGGTTLEKRSKNRSRNGQNGKSTLK